MAQITLYHHLSLFASSFSIPSTAGSTKMKDYPTQIRSLCCGLAYFLAFSMVVVAPHPPLTVGYYRRTCPSAEAIIRRTVAKAVSRHPGVGAGLIRIHFHDCFVRGCDGSVLLDSTPGCPSEKNNTLNNPHIRGGLRGFKVIDEAKAHIEAHCPATVSCADILAFAARDSARALGRIQYAVPAGRRDGRTSLESEVPLNLPFPNFNISQLKHNFARKSLSVEDLVTLSGAHSIGISRCEAFASRLYSFNETHQQHPSLDPELAVKLRCSCPRTGFYNHSASLDVTTPNRLDNVYFKNLFAGKGLRPSDQELVNDWSTVGLVKGNAEDLVGWAVKFGKAMVRMGYIDVLTGSRGEIRRNCRVVNYY